MRRAGRARTSSAPTLSERHIRSVMVVLGVGHLALGLWLALSPGTFFRSFGGFGPGNDHYVRDVATLYLALGLVLLAAARRPSWRAPILLFAILQYGFHLINHVIDVADSHPAWVGPADVVALALVEVVLIFVLRASRPRAG
jgi:hypothetical protein